MRARAQGHGCGRRHGRGHVRGLGRVHGHGHGHGRGRACHKVPCLLIALATLLPYSDLYSVTSEPGWALEVSSDSPSPDRRHSRASACCSCIPIPATTHLSLTAHRTLSTQTLAVKNPHGQHFLQPQPHQRLPLLRADIPGPLTVIRQILPCALLCQLIRLQPTPHPLLIGLPTKMPCYAHRLPHTRSQIPPLLG